MLYLLMAVGGLLADAPVAPTAPKAAIVQPVDHIEAEALTPTEALLAEQVNAERVRRGLAACVVDSSIQRQARRHAHWMASTHRMQHGTGVGENIAMGQGSVASVMSTWMNSSGHRALILSGGSRLGVAAYAIPGGRVYYCLRMYATATEQPTGAPAVTTSTWSYSNTRVRFRRR